MTRGPVYDNVLRLLATTDLEDFCRCLGIRETPRSLRVSEALPAATLHADLLVRTAPHRLEHVEFVRAPTRDLLDRMLEYRARIMRREPGSHIRQHLLVIGDGNVPTTLTDGIRTLDVTIHYLRDHDPEHLLALTGLAPLAALARPAPGVTREDLLRRALTLIATVPDPVRRLQLAEAAAVLAGIRLNASTIERITLEAHMPISLEGTVAGRQIAREAEARGETRGEARGETREREQTLATLMRRTFGDDPRIDDLAKHLSTLPRDQALDAALTATSLDDLAGLTPPTGSPARGVIGGRPPRR